MITQIFDSIHFPVWIKNKDNEVIFINNSFRSEFNISCNCKEDELEKDLHRKYKLKEVYKVIKEAVITPNEIITIEENIYKQNVFSYDISGNVVGILIPVSDVINEKNSKNDENVLTTIIDNIPELIFYKDKDLRYRNINKECKKFYSSWGIEDVIGKNDLELPLDKDFVETCKRHDSIVLETKKPLYIDEKVPIEGSSEYKILKTMKTPVIDENGETQGLVGIVRDITNQKRLEDKLRYLSYTDELTGLYNRSYFDEKISELMSKDSYPIGIITGDVNGLKMVNDTLGHVEGDRLLITISDIVSKVSDKIGFSFRWGGDEFITVLPNTSDEDCMEFIKKVNRICDRSKNNSFTLSIAQGYSLLEKDSNIEYVLRDSENKAYKEKISSSKSMRKSMLETLEKNLQVKNIETKDHTQRVCDYCIELGEKLGLDEDNLKELELVARLHDIGKIGVPESILLKEGSLTGDEYEIMKTHSEKGYRLTLLIPELSHISRSILTHHERWDGCGYPLGLKDEEIPLMARIVAIVDAYDTMTNERVYQSKVSKEEAIKELKLNANTQFDPQIVEVFCNILEKAID